MMRVGLTTIVTCTCLAAVANGQNRLDFEDAASRGGDDGLIPADYFANRGFSFSAVAGSSAANATAVNFTFEASGTDGTDAFVSRAADASHDDSTAGSLGNYFLKAGTGHMEYAKAKYFKLSIDYTEPTHRAQAEIWDIDGPEQYQVTAYDTNGNSVGTLTSPQGGLDSKPWFWRFETSGDQKIASIEISEIGSGNLRGFAFDNFEAHPGPGPAALPLGLIGLGLLTLKRRRSRPGQQAAE